MKCHLLTRKSVIVAGCVLVSVLVGRLYLVKNKVTIIETEDCHWCTVCEAVCPTGALTCSFEIVLKEE